MPVDSGPAPDTEPIVIPTAVPPDVTQPVETEPQPDTGAEAGTEANPDTADTGETVPETGEEPPPTEDQPADASTDKGDTSEAAGEEKTHVVKAGETLGQIAQDYDVSVEDIAAANNIADIHSIDAGQELVIPAAGTATTSPQTGERTHVVQRGENLFRISLRYGFTVEELAEYNDIANPARIDAGQVIRIPPSN